MTVDYMVVKRWLTLMLHVFRVFENGVLIEGIGHTMITAGHWRKFRNGDLYKKHS